MSERILQIVFILYWDGLFESLGSHWNIFGVNSITLDAKIEVNVETAAENKSLSKHLMKKVVQMTGQSDVSIARHQRNAKFSLPEFIKSCAVNGELKSFYDKLAKYKYQINSCCSQLFVENLSIAKMRQAKNLDYSFVKSCLSDFNVLSISFRVKRNGKVDYLISRQLTSSSVFFWYAVSVARLQ